MYQNLHISQKFEIRAKYKINSNKISVKEYAKFPQGSKLIMR